MKRIAVFRALQLGDLLVAVPAFRALRQHFPGAEITLMSLPWAASFAHRFNRYIDRFVEFAGYPGIDEVPFDAQRTERFLAEQRAYHYDIVLQMHGSGHTSNPFVLALGAPITVGYHKGEMPAGLTIGAIYPDEQHEIYRNLNLVRLLEHIDTFSVGTDVARPVGIVDGDEDALHRSLQDVNTIPQHFNGGRGRAEAVPTVDVMNQTIYTDTRLEFPLLASDYAEADALLRPLRQDGKPIIGLHPGARPPARRWPATYFATVADALAQQCNAHIVLTGGPGEEQMVQAVVEAMHTLALSLAGKTSLGSLAALISRFDLFISNDTGPSHVACAVDCPSVTLFGPADVQRWAPLHRQRHPLCVMLFRVVPVDTGSVPLTIAVCVDYSLKQFSRLLCIRYKRKTYIHEASKNSYLAYSRKLSQHAGAT